VSHRGVCAKLQKKDEKYEIFDFKIQRGAGSVPGQLKEGIERTLTLKNA
jgi:hypothetical protein